MDFLSSLEPSVPFYDMQVKGMAISFLSFGAPLVICLFRENIKKIWSPLLETTFIIYLDWSTLMAILLSWVKHLNISTSGQNCVQCSAGWRCPSWGSRGPCTRMCKAGAAQQAQIVPLCEEI